jgi:hypothetical protein
MAYLENKRVRVLNKLYGKTSSLWKFTLDMVLASMHLWDIINRSGEASNMDVALAIDL